MKEKTKEGRRGDLVALVDWCVGQITDYLAEIGITDDTLLIFTSNNGARIGTGGNKSAGPDRGYNSHTWEGGHREPFIVRWPGKIKPGRVSDEPIELTDIYATCAAVSGASIGQMDCPDSYNVLPAITGDRSGEPIRKALIHHSVWGVFSIREGDWKLIHESNDSGSSLAPTGSSPQAGTDGQLYNIKDDPYEEQNVWDEHPDIVRKLTAMLAKYREQGYSRPGGTA